MVDNPTDTAPAIFDVGRLHASTFGDVALEREVLTLFRTEALRTLERLRAAPPADWPLLTHTLKGSSRAVGALNLAAACELAEADSGILDPARRSQHTDRIAAAVSAVMPLVEAHLAARA